LNGLGSPLIAGLLSGSVIATVLGLMTQRRSIMLESQIQDSFKRLVETRSSQWAAEVTLIDSDVNAAYASRRQPTYCSSMRANADGPRSSG